MPKLEIIGSVRSTYTRAVCMVCEEKGIEYVLTEKWLGAPELKAIHPLGKMPVLRHGDVELFESKAIATYIDRAFPAPDVFPSDPHHAALTEQWVSLVNTVIDRTLIRTYVFAYIVPMLSGGEPDRKAIETVCRKFTRSWKFSITRSPLPAISPAINSPSPTSICCRSCIGSGSFPKAPGRSPQPAISPPIMTGTRHGRALCAPCRHPVRRAGPRRTRDLRVTSKRFHFLGAGDGREVSIHSEPGG